MLIISMSVLHMCLIECPPGTYGNNCSGTCGHCLDNSLCDRASGVCGDGCELGYMPDLCQSGR